MKLETIIIRENQKEHTAYFPWTWVIGFFGLVMASVVNAEWKFDPILRVGYNYDDNAIMSIRTDGEQQISGLVAEASVDIRSDSETSYISLRPMVRTRNYEDLYNLDFCCGVHTRRPSFRFFLPFDPTISYPSFHLL